MSINTRIKITFERGGSVYARLLNADAPETIGVLEKVLPRTAQMKQVCDTGPAIYFDYDLGKVDLENIVTQKSCGQITLNMGSPAVPGCFIRVYYSAAEIRNQNEENLFAVLEKESLNYIASIGRGIWTEGPEVASIEFC